MHHGQEFVELVRQEQMLDAIAYSREHLSPWSDLYQADLQRALAALAFRAGALCLVVFQPAAVSGKPAVKDPLIHISCCREFMFDCLSPYTTQEGGSSRPALLHQSAVPPERVDMLTVA